MCRAQGQQLTVVDSLRPACVRVVCMPWQVKVPKSALMQKFKELGQASVGRRGVVWMNGDVGRDFYSEVAVAVGGMGEIKISFHQ